MGGRANVPFHGRFHFSIVIRGALVRFNSAANASRIRASFFASAVSAARFFISSGSVVRSYSSSGTLGWR